MRDDLARALGDAFLVGEWTRSGLVASGALVLGRRARWMPRLAAQVLELYHRPPADRPHELALVLARCPAAEKAGDARPVSHPVAHTRMLRNPWQLTVLDDLGEVASLLDVTAGELDWFADPRLWARRTDQAPLQHYRVTHRVSASGSVRVLEAPKHRLKTIQRRLLDHVVGRIPPHDAAHGFRTGRSVATYAEPHSGRGTVIRLDLEGFFASVTAGRVHGVLRTAGYPEPVAHCLAGLTTTVLPARTWRRIPRPADTSLLDGHWRLGRRLARPHLPQGAPTSPALANLACFALDVRLSALAESWGARYTRYADDLALSGATGWRDRTPGLLAAVEEVVRDEGFRLNPHKTAVLPRAGRQVLGGLVVNETPKVSRAEVDTLRAIVHNCLRHGPSTQNRDDRPGFEAHLAGRIAWVAQHDPARGARLRAELARVDWNR